MYTFLLVENGGGKQPIFIISRLCQATLDFQAYSEDRPGSDGWKGSGRDPPIQLYKTTSNLQIFKSLSAEPSPKPLTDPSRPTPTPTAAAIPHMSHWAHTGGPGRGDGRGAGGTGRGGG